MLGQQACGEKSNEITAIPELLKLLDLKGAVVTIDAMGCQKEIAREIIASGGDYVLAVKENQLKLVEALRGCFDGWHEEDFQAGDCRRRKTSEKGRGRVEERYYYHAPLPESLRPFVKDWTGLATIGQAISITERDGKQTSEVRYYISSLPPEVKKFASAVRGHWPPIQERGEDSLHWVLDVTFGEDQSRIRKDHGPENFALLRRLAVSVIKQDTSPGSIRKKRKRAAWNRDELAKIAGLTG
ncbi:Transposase DDE domain protein [Pirellulimonas nuda]|uniref:Transposase DDE domain protein n=1 Tax=Pirellulimonas nuda TaxID=2528009 RepID=A0A518DBV6_9BACT|nr:ISAs1 family transposase [Pirellulimonas nuda]QDU88940.1 Transposase DDE domain protein [Pirellulimonas nuda]